MSSSKLTLSDHWIVERVKFGLLFVGGADRVFIEELDEDVAKKAEKLLKKPFSLKSVDVSLKPLVQELLLSSIIKPDNSKVWTTSYTYLDKSSEKLLKKILAPDTTQSSDLEVVVRGSILWKTVIDRYVYPEKPQLLVDIAYGHSVAIGPLVIPGYTACFACMAGKVVTQWGDHPVPKAPEIHQGPLLIAGLIQNAVRNIRSKPEQYVNACYVFDGDELTVTKHSIVRFPDCLACGGSDKKFGGPLPLWWEK